MKKSFFTPTLFVILPILIGGSIYTLYRSTNLLVFKWINNIGFLSNLLTVRNWLHPLKGILPKWFLYSFPDALWIFSLTLFIGLIWYNGDRKRSILILMLSLFCGVIPEILQMFNLLKGTFDLTDIWFEIFASILAIITIHLFKKEAVCFQDI
jgi:hypothetical protein